MNEIQRDWRCRSVLTCFVLECLWTAVGCPSSLPLTVTLAAGWKSWICDRSNKVKLVLYQTRVLYVYKYEIYLVRRCCSVVILFVVFWRGAVFGVSGMLVMPIVEVPYCRGSMGVLATRSSHLQCGSLRTRFTFCFQNHITSLSIHDKDLVVSQ